ncbi:MAG: NifU family protein [Bdellovibrio sp.]
MNSNSIQVRIEGTPNPSTLKFLFSQTLIEDTYHFETAQEAERSPLAAKIFGFPWTSRISLAPDHIAVSKQDWVEWEVLSEALRNLIQEHLEQNLGLLIKGFDEEDSEILAEDPPIVRQIKEILRRDIKPVVALDGGDIVFASFENGVLSVRLKGSCNGCPSSQATLKQGVEARLRELLPEVKEVISI